MIEAEAADDAAPFRSTAFDITDRPTTPTAVTWDPPEWLIVGAAGPEQQTPDLAPLLQQVVNRPGWSAGNALALLITGTGNARTAESYDGDPSAAPLLEIVYLGPPAPGQETLGVNVVGSGSVALSPPGGSYDPGTSLTLTATPDPGFSFAGWSGDLSGTANPATLGMDADKTVTATFVAQHFTLTLNVVGSGNVGLSPPGGTYDAGTLVRLRARPSKRLSNWSGDLSGSSPTETLVMDSDKDVTANF